MFQKNNFHFQDLEIIPTIPINFRTNVWLFDCFLIQNIEKKVILFGKMNLKIDDVKNIKSYPKSINNLSVLKNTD